MMCPVVNLMNIVTPVTSEVAMEAAVQTVLQASVWGVAQVIGGAILIGGGIVGGWVCLIAAGLGWLQRREQGRVS